jgi:Zn-dependent M28 family amino/carboxypeptidase
MMTEYGTNIIGILPGRHWEQPTDKPVIVGAHWDSFSNTTGFNDNGSGVAVLLEVRPWVNHNIL